MALYSAAFKYGIGREFIIMLVGPGAARGITDGIELLVAYGVPVVSTSVDVCEALGDEEEAYDAMVPQLEHTVEQSGRTTVVPLSPHAPHT